MPHISDESLTLALVALKTDKRLIEYSMAPNDSRNRAAIDRISIAIEEISGALTANQNA